MEEIIPGLNLETLAYSQNAQSSTPSGLRHAKLAVLSDIFRFNVLKKVGGWYCDTDVFCLKNQSEWSNLRDGKPFAVANEYLGEKIWCGSAVLYFNDTFAKNYLESYNEFLNDTKGKKQSWGTFGPAFLTKYIAKNNMTEYVLPRPTFYPINWSEIDLIIDKTNYEQAKEMMQDACCYALHCWGGVLFGKRGFSKDNPPAGILLSHLMNLSK